MKYWMILLFVLCIGLVPMSGCDVASDDVEEPVVEEVENEVPVPDVDNEVIEDLKVEEEVVVPHMLGCPCCSSV